MTLTSQVVSPTPPVQATAANITAASGDTTSTSQSTLQDITNMLSSGVNIGGYSIPTIVLVGASAALLYFMSEEGHKGRRY
jgi:hypothetical protein